MKSFKNAIKDIFVLIAYIGPLVIVGIDEMNIVLKAIIAGITFLCNALYHHRTSNIERDFAELKYKHKQDIQRYEEWIKKDEEYLSFYKEQLDIAYTKNEKLRQEIEIYKEAGKL